MSSRENVPKAASRANQGPIFGYSFENCRYCILGCGRDHSVFYGPECSTHKENRMALLQAQYLRDRQPDGLPGSPKEDNEGEGDKIPLEWECKIDGKITKSCKLMASLNTKSYLEPPAELIEKAAKARGETEEVARDNREAREAVKDSGEAKETEGQLTRESGDGDASEQLASNDDD
ncbi:hypothetical protein DV738_g3703, partial [Chaetothyriales sp. CBS 135597]